jgi:uncharacterized protein HemX
MPELNQKTNRRNHSWLTIALALTVGFLAAHVDYRPQAVQAEVRKTQKRTAFQSGAARSESLLREISGTLKTIDARLQRIERSVAGK